MEQLLVLWYHGIHFCLCQNLHLNMTGFCLNYKKMTTIKLLDVINRCLCSISLHVFVIDRGKESFEAPASSLEFK
jgi:hypothetical protein